MAFRKRSSFLQDVKLPVFHGGCQNNVKDKEEKEERWEALQYREKLLELIAAKEPPGQNYYELN